MARKDKAAEVVTAAVYWWCGHRPAGWDEERHLTAPAVNVKTDAEHTLAMAVAEYISAGRRAKGKR